MVSAIDIYRSAKLLVDKQGKEARVHAAMRVDELSDDGYLDGHRVWLCILKVVEELLAKRPAPGQKVH
ncbi:MAG: hypothetical protein ACE5LL_07865 [Alphaproteobacteria bacterium]